MPELPEVETVRRTLVGLITGKTVSDVIVTLPRIIRRPLEAEAFAAELRGQTIRGIRRYGKYLCIDFDDAVMISHLRMEGKYGVYGADEPKAPHTHVVFQFTDGTELRYRDVRQFGTMEIVPPGKEWELTSMHKLGPEPLDVSFSAAVWLDRSSRRRGKIKPLLLDQTLVAGIGNIYADEMLHRANIHPECLLESLSNEEKIRLYHALRNVLQEAVDQGGSSVKSYVNGQGEMGYFQQVLRVYGKTNEDCLACGNKIVKMVLAGRGTHYCPVCQPSPNN